MVDENAEQAPQSYITIQFIAPGSVVFNSNFENITPLQLLAMAHYFEFEGKVALQEERVKRQQEQPQIALPGIPNVNMDRKL